jgi:hypothetical protein
VDEQVDRQVHLLLDALGELQPLAALLAKPVHREVLALVLSIFSASAICEKPGFFAFDVECPIPPRPGIDELGRDRLP